MLYQNGNVPHFFVARVLCTISQDGSKRYLMVQRSTGPKELIGLWEFPGGKDDHFVDGVIYHNLAYTAEQETYEEAAYLPKIDPDPVRVMQLDGIHYTLFRAKSFVEQGNPEKNTKWFAASELEQMIQNNEVTPHTDIIYGVIRSPTPDYLFS